MNHAAFFAVLVAAALGIAAAIRPAKSTPRSDYDARPSLLTAAELHFKQFLDQAVPATITIMAQVALEEIITVRPSVRGKHWARARGRIKARRVDFVLCDSETFQIHCAIELNDRSHQRSDRQARDKFVRSALAAAGVPFVEIPAARTYDISVLRSQIEQATQPATVSAARSPTQSFSTAR